MVRSLALLALVTTGTATAHAGWRCARREPPELQAPTTSTYKAPPDVARALATYRAAATAPGTPAQQPAIAAAQLIFARVPFVGMPAAEVRTLIGAPSATSTEPGGDERWRYLRHNGEGVGAIHVLRIHAGAVASVVSFPTQ
ncbi:MAG: hypothetical protein KF773_06575 [Deltaproteobacteria bacterium]|nr:hypothetical protein [Deltaproteobacteria bacterium]MCW5803346.1 hypothetical protein [Deltaproteobacteria bacterium]